MARLEGVAAAVNDLAKLDASDEADRVFLLFEILKLQSQRRRNAMLNRYFGLWSRNFSKFEAVRATEVLGADLELLGPRAKRNLARSLLLHGHVAAGRRLLGFPNRRSLDLGFGVLGTNDQEAKEFFFIDQASHFREKYLRSQAVEHLSFWNELVDSLSEKGDFQDTAFSLEYGSSLLQTIRNKLVHKQPFSLVRLGEGEGILGHMDSDTTHEFVKHWWGEHPGSSELAGIRRDLDLTVRNSDVVGVPSEARIVRDFAVPQSSRHFRGIRALSGYLRSVPSRGQLWSNTEIWWAIGILNPMKVLSEVAERIVVVGPHNRLRRWSEESASEIQSGKIQFAEVPPHGATHEGKLSKPSIVRYRTTLEKEALKDLKPGDLLLVGGGIAAKSLVLGARSQGAVGLDIGAALPHVLRKIVGWGF